ncbi:MAG: hypothetical protein HOP12_05125 [Candidatus Eisenbacteria bacterium]|uniref:FAD-binding FR-type domain-containing protein n=1 Tax=Eiseniibacteriota bacterium TaxID=2212470 RepID=A0A849SCV0_UNCEI|nr:hypothetical protein [Candidatus Eisenbacteria bacterium]
MTRAVTAPRPSALQTRASLAEYRPTWSQAIARVTRHEDYGAGHRWLDLEVSSGMTVPVAGQFVQLLLVAPSPVLLPRPMSIADAKLTRGRLTLSFLYAPVGTGTQSLAALGPGDAIELLGPLGRGYPLEESGTPVLIAGGRGVAPLLFAADALAAQSRPCVFLFGARTRELLVGLDDAKRRLSKSGSELHLATDDGSRGTRGNVLLLLERLRRTHPGPLVIHSCGPHRMLEAVARWALTHGRRAHLAMESVMACGTGVCRGCPMPRSEESRRRFDRERGTSPSLYGNQEYAMCCTEGPVFAAADLDWDRVE